MISLGRQLNGIAAIGAVSSAHTWSGIPHHFWRAAAKRWPEIKPWDLDYQRLAGRRAVWNALQVVRGLGAGGFQYSRSFLDRAEAQIPDAFWKGTILSFNQHFPRSASVRAKGGRLVHYIDAPFAALAAGSALPVRLPKAIQEEALASERENYAGSERIYCMARWCADAVVDLCGVPRSKVQVVLPGASLPAVDTANSAIPGQPGHDRPLVLGFVGKDWVRKGLPFQLHVAEQLHARGLRVTVRAAGFDPRQGPSHPLLECVGYIRKDTDPLAFMSFLRAADFGCLFSSHEALGISTLEFLGAGVPVMGLAHEGLADTLPPDAGLRFSSGISAEAVAGVLEQICSEDGRLLMMRRAAACYAGLVTWDRCVREIAECEETGRIARPAQPWLGLAENTASEGGDTA